MQTHRSRYGLVVVVSALVVVALFALALRLLHRQPRAEAGRIHTVPVERPAIQPQQLTASAPVTQVVVGTPAFYGPPVHERYRYRNGFENRADLSGPFTLYVIDNETGQETQLGNMDGGAVYSGQNDEYMLWHFLCVTGCGEFQQGLHAYAFATGVDHFISAMSSSAIHPQIFGDWIAFGREQPKAKMATLYAGNLQTHEVLTLTKTLWMPNASVNGYFGISAALAAWYDPPDGIVVYDLQNHHALTRITDLFRAFSEQTGPVYDLSVGETVVIWNGGYGYDLVTHSYFRLGRVTPPDGGDGPFVDMSRVQEVARVLSWSFTYKDGTRRDVRAPLFDATPSATPCVEGQNLVQNGNLEDIGAHNVWQQSGSPSDLLVNDLPANSPQAGQWAIRLGRYSNAQQTIQQTLNIPSGVKHITLAFDVRALSWDIWGGDQLQVDLIDPVTNQSILATPVQWTNVQLATGGWVPLQVDIQDWPGIDTPLYLVFRATTDWAFPTDFTVDNIRFTTSCQ